MDTRQSQSYKFKEIGKNSNMGIKKTALVQIMAWHWPGDMPLSEPMMVRLQMHVCLNELMTESVSLCISGGN